MTDKIKREAAPQEPEKEPAAAADENKITQIELTDGGEPLPIDPDTGEIDADKLTDEQLEKFKKAASVLMEGVKADVAPVVNAANKYNTVLAESARTLADVFTKASGILTTDEWKALQQEISENWKPIQDVLDELRDLEPFIKTELKKDEYGGLTFDDILHEYTPGELLELRRDPDSLLSKAIEAAKARYEIVQAQQAGREQRKETHQKAADANAVMQLRRGNYWFFSQRELWDAFAPGRICRMGTLPAEYIDENTGLIRKAKFDDGEIVPLNAADISYRAFTLLNSILANTVENIRENPVKNGEIKFYVKGVLDTITDDPRTLLDDQISFDLSNPLNRKTAGVLYLENLFEPLQGYIGTTLNGSRYTVFNYIGYDFESDTMTVQLPYLYELWKSTQGEYFVSQQNKQKAIAENRRPKKADITPLKINSLFKNKAYTADEITLEIAVYITNVLLAAGNTGRAKKTEIEYYTIIENCPRLKCKLQEIESSTELENPAARYNDQLKKIATAFDLIHDPDQCDALKHYDFIDIKPGRITKAGKFKFIPPTKKKLNGKLTIVWIRKPDDDLQ